MTDATTLPPPPASPQADGSPPDADADAPYGRKSDGTPYKRPPRAYDLQRRAMKGKPGAKRYGRKNSTKRTRPVSPPSPTTGRSADDYATIAAETIIGWPLSVALGIGMQTGNTTLLADAWALDRHGPPIADQLGTIATRSPRVASALEWAQRLNGPAGVATALMPLWLQLGANRGKVRPGVMQTIPPEVAAQDVLNKAHDQMMNLVTTAAAWADASDAQADDVPPPPPPPPPSTPEPDPFDETETHVSI